MTEAEQAKFRGNVKKYNNLATLAGNVDKLKA